MSATEKKFTVLALATILLVSAGLHIYRIDYPAQPVFDETYFATQAADYLEHIPFVDLHPPLGKLIYSGALALTGKPLGNAQFVNITWNSAASGTVANYDPTRTYGDYPYVVLRLLSALFGLSLILVFYFLLRSLGISNVGAVLGAALVALENSLLIETRLILMNGMYLVFGLAALTCYFKKKSWPLVAGVFLGMALGVKMIAIVFLPPLIVYRYLMKRSDNAKEYRFSLLKLLGTALIVYLAIFSLTNLYFTPQEQYGALAAIKILPTDASAFTSFKDFTSFRSRVLLFLIEEEVSFSNYIGGTLNHPAASPWYLWPAMLIPMSYYVQGAQEIKLVGNPAVWLPSTLAVIFAIAIFHRFGRKKMAGAHDREKRNTFFILLLGYFSALYPFFTFIRRSTYLYHYFPALLFSIGLLVWFVNDWLKLDNFSNLTKKQGIILSAIILVAAVGFLSGAKFVYGF